MTADQRRVETCLKTFRQNLRELMAESEHYSTANALAVAIGVSPNTIRLYLKEETPQGYRPAKKGPSAPTLDKVALIADKLGCQVWELLHPHRNRLRDDLKRLSAIDAAVRGDDADKQQQGRIATRIPLDAADEKPPKIVRNSVLRKL